MNVNQTHCGHHFTVYTNIKSLRCAPETKKIKKEEKVKASNTSL